MATGLRLVAERAGEGAGQPILDAENGEELKHIQSGVSVVLGNRPPVSPGTLYVTTKKVVWLSDTDRTKGYAVDFLSISLHAVSTDPQAYPSPCIYAQIDTGAHNEESEESDSAAHETLDLLKITEMRLVPSDPSQLDTLFKMFCECAELNPEPIVDDELEHNWVFNADQMDEGDNSQNPMHGIGCSNGDHDLAQTVRQLQINDQRFEDAEEMDTEEHNDLH